MAIAAAFSCVPSSVRYAVTPVARIAARFDSDVMLVTAGSWFAPIATAHEIKSYASEAHASLRHRAFLSIKESSMTTIEKVIFSGKTLNTVNRDPSAQRGYHGVVDIKLSAATSYPNRWLA